MQSRPLKTLFNSWIEGKVADFLIGDFLIGESLQFIKDEFSGGEEPTCIEALITNKEYFEEGWYYKPYLAHNYEDETMKQVYKRKIKIVEDMEETIGRKLDVYHKGKKRIMDKFGECKWSNKQRQNIDGNIRKETILMIYRHKIERLEKILPLIKKLKTKTYPDLEKKETHFIGWFDKGNPYYNKDNEEKDRFKPISDDNIQFTCIEQDSE